MKLKISKEQFAKAVDFAEQRIDKSSKLYAYRGESKVDKMIDDIVIGTVGEFGVAKYLRSRGLTTTRPDLKIYEAKRKSFDADLFAHLKIDEEQQITKTYNIHVKSQGVTSAKRYGNSWLLQKSDKIVKEPGKNDLFVFTNVDGLEVEILGVVACKDIIDFDLLDECKVPYYRHSKHALYFKDIKETLSKHRLWRL
jgi:hypothetical protein